MDTDAVLELLQEVSAEVIEPRFRGLAEAEIHEKGPGDLVTDADHEAERLITSALAAAHPDAVVLGEEAVSADPRLLDAYATAEHAFTLDPVDGTRNFVHGSPDHAVMVAELRAGAVVRAWIWQPQHRSAYVAELGGGAYRNGERLRTTAPDGPPASWRLVTARRGWVGRRLTDLPAFELSWVCCGVDYPQLIDGAAAALVYFSARPWDHAPGSLLVAESGGVVLDQHGDAYDPRRPHVGGLVVAPDRATADVVLGGWGATSDWP